MASETKKIPAEGDGIQPVTSTQIVIDEDNVKHIVTDAGDEAVQFLASVGPFPPMSPDQEKKLVRKIDRWMIPMLLFLGLFGAVDKVQLATGALYGFKEDNHLKGQEYSWLGSILSIGMLVGIWPSTYLVHRLPAGKYIGACSFCWSIMTLCIAACHNWAGLMVLRFMMGVFEAIITPGLTLLISVFWKKSEQPIRNGVIMSVFSSVVNGFLSWVVGKIPSDAPLARWQYLYLLTGSINVLYSSFMLFYLPNSPINAKFLSLEERWHAVQRLADNRTGIDNNQWNWDQAWEAVFDLKIWIMFLFNIAINIPNGGLITFGAIIIDSLGFDPQTSSLLSMPNGIISTISGFIATYYASKWQGRRTFVVMIATLPPLIGTALVYGVPRSSTGVQMFGLYLMYCYWGKKSVDVFGLHPITDKPIGPYVTAVSLPQANTAGSTKKVVAYGILLLGYSAGNLIGPQTFRDDQAPAYTGGTVAMLTCYCVAIFLMCLYFLTARFQNRRKDQRYGKPVRVDTENFSSVIETYQNLSDRKQEDFRYIY
ncbi:hypothetical protein N7468_005518 [Penicillium chermesinum]|uniref:Major facilitator superfamily (MFS) profile domain-containing protein n=1 Tax=Penicillium chermesinum TaxID=63820 RepID=A0A9W9NZF9_9EURO|nr:uncharacterized protein N7468_005518 [Penicillium chermesinum]KAJ5232562.1 hypothetical protein N7468_005518 [Penicillium chermesinum]KAJ6172218.1 hypothetical protein N7470_001285 [Penicillium chermesinum]